MNSNTIGQYQLLEKIDQGGMAEIYRARRSGPHGFEKIVAIKKILPHLANDQDFINMFSSEAKVTAQLQHPNIVQIHDYGKENGTYYLAMEYIHGINLNDLLTLLADAHQKLSLAQIIYIIKHVCAALEYAHFLTDFRGRSLAIVHRDINPKNIMIAFSGEIKLMDFGIALASTRSFQTLADGMIKGKIAYISPEQVKSEDIDHRSDIFSLGIVIYELITGVRPFQSNTDFGILKKIEQAVIVPPEQIVTNLPPELTKIVTKSLSRDRRNRYYSTGDIRLALEKIETATGLRTDQSAFRKFLESVIGRDIVRSPLLNQSNDMAHESSVNSQAEEQRWNAEVTPTIQINRPESRSSKPNQSFLHEPTRIITSYKGPSQQSHPTNSSSDPLPKRSASQSQSEVKARPEPELQKESLTNTPIRKSQTQSTPPPIRESESQSNEKKPVVSSGPNDRVGLPDQLDDDDFFNNSPSKDRSHFGLIITIVLGLMALGGVFFFGWEGILKIIGLAETEYHASLMINAIPSTAKVQVDFVDQPADSAETAIAWPFQSKHSITLAHPDFKAVSFDLIAPPDSNGLCTLQPSEVAGVTLDHQDRKINISVKLTPQYLKLPLKTNPKGAKVSVNGVDTQKTTPFDFSFDVDSESTIVFEKDGYERKEMKFQPDTTKPSAGVAVELKKLATTPDQNKPDSEGSPAATGRVIIKSPYPVTIASSKGILASSVKEKTVVLLAGKQTLTFTNPDYLLNISKTVTVSDAKPVTINLERLGTMIVDADPPGCKILIDDKTLGVAPGQFELAPGLYNVVFKWEQCEATESRWVKVITEQNKKVPKVMGCK